MNALVSGKKEFFSFKKLCWLAVRIVCYYAVLVGVVYFMQDKLLYVWPAPCPLPESLEKVQEIGCKAWPEQGGNPLGWMAYSKAEKGRGTFLVAHGNAGTALARGHYVRALGRMGFDVLLYEYPGYGHRARATPREALVAGEIGEITRRLAREGRGPIYWLGESLGAGVVSSAAADSSVPVSGIILVTPWDSLLEVAQRPRVGIEKRFKV